MRPKVIGLIIVCVLLIMAMRAIYKQVCTLNERQRVQQQVIDHAIDQ